MDTVKCEKCGGIMEYKRDSSTQGWYCTDCNWCVVTSYMDPIRQDNQE